LEDLPPAPPSTPPPPAIVSRRVESLAIGSDESSRPFPSPSRARPVIFASGGRFFA
jgi:hypothetical protein